MILCNAAFNFVFLWWFTRVWKWRVWDSVRYTLAFHQVYCHTTKQVRTKYTRIMLDQRQNRCPRPIGLCWVSCTAVFIYTSSKRSSTSVFLGNWRIINQIFIWQKTNKFGQDRIQTFQDAHAFVKLLHPTSKPHPHPTPPPYCEFYADFVVQQQIYNLNWGIRL